MFKNSGPQRDFQGCTEGPFERPYKAASQCTVHQIGPSVFTGPPHTGPYCGLRNTPEWLWLLTPVYTRGSLRALLALQSTDPPDPPLWTRL